MVVGPSRCTKQKGVEHKLCPRPGKRTTAEQTRVSLRDKEDLCLGKEYRKGKKA